MDEKRDLSVYSMDTVIGPLTLAIYEEKLCHVDFGTVAETRQNLMKWAESVGLPTKIREETTVCEAARQIEDYFSGRRKSFDLKLLLKGTEFQKKVWTALTRIPYGRTCTYKEIAMMIGNPGAARAVGGANNKNPLPIVVPCHRVIGKDGSLVGYGGGLAVKKELLQIEDDRQEAASK